MVSPAPSSSAPAGTPASPPADSTDHPRDSLEAWPLPEFSDSEPPEDDPDGPCAESEGTSDHDLIRRAQAGEEEAFSALVLRHEARACRVAAGLVANREDARDLAQEAFLRVFRNLERFDFQHEFTTWLYRIVTNLAIDHLRRRRPQVSTSSVGDEEAALDLPDEGAPSPSAGLEREETAAMVRACIDRLPPHFKSAMALRELEGLSCKKIAEIVGATHVTVRWRLHRGRKLFLDEWERMTRAGGVGTFPAADGGEDGFPANTPRTCPVELREDAGGDRNDPPEIIEP